MIKPVWAAVAGLALLGTAGGVGLLIASPGGEKEAAVQNQQTASVASTATPDSAPSPTSAITPSPTASAPTPGPSGTLWRWGKVTVRIPAASDVRVSHESVLADLKPPNGGLAISLTRDVPLGGPSSSLLIDADTGAVLVDQVRDEDRAAIDEVFKTLAVSPLDVAIAPWPYNGDPPPELEKRREGKIGYLVPAPQTGIFVAPGISDFCASPECAELDDTFLAIFNGVSNATVSTGANGLVIDVSRVLPEDRAAFDRYLASVIFVQREESVDPLRGIMNFMSALRRTSPLAFASLVLIMAAAAPSDASHTFKDSGRFAGNMLYPDLEQAGDHVINYALCANPVPWEWTAGVENWDASFGTSMDFNGVACLSNQETKLTWEGADGSCPPGASACWLYPLPGEYVTHGDHFDLLNGHRVILFNSVIYYQFSPSCRVSISAHEWGHNMSLEDHDAENPCTIGSIMGKGGIDPASNSCVESPTGKDMTTVWCVVYRSCSWHGFQDWGPAADLTPGGIAYAQRAARLCSHGPPVLRRFLLEVLDGRRVDRLAKHGTVPSDPVFAGSVAVSLGDGQVHFAGISSSGQLWHRWRNNAGQWNDWTYLGAPPEGALNGPIAIANSGGQIHIVAIRNGTVYLRIYNGGWWGWENHGGPITGSVAVADRGGLIHIVGFGSPSPNVYMRWWNLSSWQGWEWLGCCLDDTLAVDNANALRYNTVGTPHVGVHVAAFSSQSAYIRCWDVYCLGSGWDYQGGPAYGGPAALTNTYGEVHLVVRSSLNLYHRWRAP